MQLLFLLIKSTYVCFNLKNGTGYKFEFVLYCEPINLFALLISYRNANLKAFWFLDKRETE